MNEEVTRFLNYKYDMDNLGYVDFKCTICGELFTRYANATKEDDNALSISLKVHDQLHDYHNDWVTENHATKETNGCGDKL